MKRTRQSSKPCVPGCKMLKRTSTAAGYSGSCNIARNARIVLEVSGNSGGTFSNSKRYVVLYMHLCLRLSVLRIACIIRGKIKAYKVYMERSAVYRPEAFKYYL